MNDTTTLYPEYGARVHVNAGVLHSTNAYHGTIVRDPKNPHGPVVIHLDDMEDQWDRLIFQPTEFVVTMAPSVSAQELLTRWSADELFEAMEKLADIDSSKLSLATYQSAFIFEIYRLTMYGERVWDIAAHANESDDDYIGDAYEGMAQDDGTGYPVYRDEI